MLPASQEKHPACVRFLRASSWGKYSHHMVSQGAPRRPTYKVGTDACWSPGYGLPSDPSSHPHAFIYGTSRPTHQETPVGAAGCERCEKALGNGDAKPGGRTGNWDLARSFLSCVPTSSCVRHCMGATRACTPFAGAPLKVEMADEMCEQP